MNPARHIAVALLFFAASAVAREKPKPEPRVITHIEEPVLPTEPAISAAEIRQTLEHIQQLAREDAARLTEAAAENDRLVLALNTATAALQSGKGEVEAVKREQAALRQWGLDQQTRADREQAEANLQRGLAWKWRLYFFGLVAAAAAFFIARQYLPVLKFL